MSFMVPVNLHHTETKNSSSFPPSRAKFCISGTIIRTGARYLHYRESYLERTPLLSRKNGLSRQLVFPGRFILHGFQTRWSFQRRSFQTGFPVYLMMWGIAVCHFNLQHTPECVSGDLKDALNMMRGYLNHTETIVIIISTIKSYILRISGNIIRTVAWYLNYSDRNPAGAKTLDVEKYYTWNLLKPNLSGGGRSRQVRFAWISNEFPIGWSFQRGSFQTGFTVIWNSCRPFTNLHTATNPECVRGDYDGALNLMWRCSGHGQWVSGIYVNITGQVERFLLCHH